MICISLGNPDFRKCQEIICSSEFADCLFELRTDILRFSIEQYAELIECGADFILTLKPNESNYIENIKLLKKFTGKAKYIDLPFDTTEEFLTIFRNGNHNRKTKLILSYHNFDYTPEIEVLTGIALAACKSGADIVKIVCRANTQNDCSKILSLYTILNSKFQTINEKCRLNAFALGQIGRITRIAASYLGAPITYCSAYQGGETADGQFDAATLKLIMKMIDGKK